MSIRMNIMGGDVQLFDRSRQIRAQATAIHREADRLIKWSSRLQQESRELKQTLQRIQSSRRRTRPPMSAA